MNVITGNFNIVANEHKGWVVGHFMEESSPLKTNDLEIKWGVNKAGDTKIAPAKNTQAKSLAILIKGKVKLQFNDKDITLRKEGDYCFYDAGVSHSWIVEEDSLTITIRWPSLSGDQTPHNPL